MLFIMVPTCFYSRLLTLRVCWEARLKQAPMKKIEFQDLDMFLKSDKKQTGPTKKTEKTCD